MKRAVIHILNDQPIVADLLDEPKPGDISLICTNLRTLDNKRPVFVDHSDSVFVFPYGVIRFVEIPSGAPSGDAAPAPEAEELEIDEAFLRRIRDA